MPSKDNSKTVKTAEEIFSDIINSWPEKRKSYAITFNELKIFITDGAEIKKIKKSKDHTFYYKINYRGKIFLCSSLEEIK
jgi:hypothetical protein